MAAPLRSSYKAQTREGIISIHPPLPYDFCPLQTQTSTAPRRPISHRETHRLSHPAHRRQILPCSLEFLTGGTRFENSPRERSEHIAWTERVDADACFGPFDC